MSPLSTVAGLQVLPDSFLEPVRLWLLLAVAAVAALYVVLQFRRRQYAVRFTNVDLLDKIAPDRPGWRRHLPATGFLLALTILVVAFARPSQETAVAREQATIIMAIDTSLSMEATDVPPSRIEAAKIAAVAFVEGLPESINLGLVSFNGIATIRVQPTTNHTAVISSIESLDVGPATAIGEAIFASLDSVDLVGQRLGAEAPPARIVLMSDGETTVGRPDEDGVAAAQEAGIAVSTIAFGTDEGVIDIPEENFPVQVPVDEESLAAIAEATGGQFFTAVSAEELTAVYDNIGSQVSFETIEDEISPTFVGLGLLLLALTGAASLFWFSRLP